MMLLSVIKKSIKEQVRSFWILILTISMAPFFVLIYYLINESSVTSYSIVILNQDKGISLKSGYINYGDLIIENVNQESTDSLNLPVRVRIIDDRSVGIKRVKNKQADAFIIFPPDFSEIIKSISENLSSESIEVEFIGDLTNFDYMVSAIWIDEVMDQTFFTLSGFQRPFTIRETFLGVSGDINEFDVYIPGILVISIIMLMFTTSIAIITEVENKTILRLKLSKVGSFRLLGGVSIVQLLVGIISVFITLFTAIWMGFNYSGSLFILLFISILTCLSIIAFSLIIAGFTKSVNEILIVGNFPLFLFMFFSGAAFPMQGNEIFSISGYPISIQGLMSPTHAISALKKTLIYGMGVSEIIPEILLIIFLTILYFLIGVWIFKTRHMKVA